MIISKIQGGLGNQLFQWAFAKSLSEKYNKSLYLDLNFYNNQIGVTKREFSLNKFPNLRYKIHNQKPKSSVIRITDDFIFRTHTLLDNYIYYLDVSWSNVSNEIEVLFVDVDSNVKDISSFL